MADDPTICWTGNESTADELAARLRVPADLHEVRLDLLAQIESAVWELIAAHGPRLVVACRPSWEAGAFSGPEEERLRLLARAAEAGAAYVDVELAAFERGESIALPGHARVVLSHHTRRRGPGVLADVLQRASHHRADVVKVALPVSGAEDLAALAREARAWSRADRPLVVIGLGAEGIATRARPTAFGSAWTYVALDENHKTAPGQLSIDHALRLRVRDAAKLEPLVLVGGRQVLSSPGPDVYNGLFAAMALPYQYLPLPATTFDGAVEAANELGAKWLSVTMPFKREAAARARDPLVSLLGAANTVRLEGGAVAEAWNTDAPAALDLLSGALPPGGTVLVLGAGGSAAAVLWAVRELGGKAVVAARSPERARASLPESLRGEVIAWEERYRSAHDVLVNCTPLGTLGLSHPWSPDKDLLASIVLDLAVRRDQATPLIVRARTEGRTTIGGFTFWAAQGALQMSLMTGVPFERAAIDAELGALCWGNRRRHPKKSIVLVGMRGAGKTTAGRMLAARLGWRFIDTDTEVERRAGRSIGDLFARDEVQLFRDLEARVVAEALRADRAVVATGGGCVEDERTRALLANEFTICLSARAEVLASRVAASDRPSLTGAAPDAEVANVLAERREWYQSLSRFTLPTGMLVPSEVCDVVEHAWRKLSHRHLR